MRLALVVLAVCSLAAPTRADQCQIVDADVATWAQKLLVKGVSVINFCEPCGDKKPAAPVTVSRVEVHSSSGGKQLSMNGNDIDLAYVFVQTGKSTYSNVAMLVGCPVQQVSSFIAPPAKQASTKHKLPASCTRYTNLVEKLARCEKLPQASRDAMRQGLDAMREGWRDVESLPDDAFKALDDACQQGADAVEQGAHAAGCW